MPAVFVRLALLSAVTWYQHIHVLEVGPFWRPKLQGGRPTDMERFEKSDLCYNFPRLGFFTNTNATCPEVLFLFSSLPPWQFRKQSVENPFELEVPEPARASVVGK